ncbi:DUF2605 domain-containing protein [Argonema galeatum]|uniref:DUF2605 domain-containing protein n=1 Tax=Argonema galeatum TaxID=2942762 RepID=UPI0020128C0A|nr:DUF2605 domain-containing protein [Argonema galeatum]MCL1465052.1 DUF2605 domain-containing protein [Argonema galeatum A003/A1]
MLNSNLPESELLKSLLQPLLEDFQYWFGRSRDLLETKEISFLSQQQQSDLLARVKHAQSEVSTVEMLYKATGGQAGVETAALIPWHRLVMECWQVGMRFRLEQSTEQKQDKETQD